jgi:hypothetical protein
MPVARPVDGQVGDVVGPEVSMFWKVALFECFIVCASNVVLTCRIWAFKFVSGMVQISSDCHSILVWCNNDCHFECKFWYYFTNASDLSVAGHQK